MARALRVFIGYAHDDIAGCRRLKEHLAGLARAGRLELWTDAEISAGADWAGSIREAVERADLVLCLVSSAFVASDYCTQVELAQALRQRASGTTVVIPVQYRAVAFEQTPLSDLQATPVIDGRLRAVVEAGVEIDEHWVVVARAIEKRLDAAPAEVRAPEIVRAPTEAGPVLVLELRHVTGSPWNGEVRPSYEGDAGDVVEVSELVGPEVSGGDPADAREELRWYIETYLYSPIEGGNVTRAKRVEDALAEWGERLWDRLSDGDVVPDWWRAVCKAGSGRIELRAEAVSDEVAFRTPWELMRAGGRGGEPGRPLHQHHVDVVRRPRTERAAAAPLDTTQGLRVLAVVARPENTSFLDPRYTPEAILDALRGRPEIQVDFCRPPTKKRLQQMLADARIDHRPYHVLHFDGHGTTMPDEAGVGALCFEDDQAQNKFVRAQELAELLSGERLPVAVLEACRTADKVQSEETVASALVRHGVGSVLAMGYAVHVDLTKVFMERFYRAIAQGASLAEAVQEGRRAASADPERRVGRGPDALRMPLQDWFVPQLFQAGADPTLLPQPPAATARPEPPVEGFPSPPQAGFVGRARDLHRLERLLHANPIVVLEAPGGMGKTALATEAAPWWVRSGLTPAGALFVSFERVQSVSQLRAELAMMLYGVVPDGEARLDAALASEPWLLVWDNFESVLPAFGGDAETLDPICAQARQWTRGKTRILVTCRAPAEKTGLPNPIGYALGRLDTPDALFLVTRILERHGISQRDRAKRGLGAQALTPLVEHVGGHPLVLELLTPHLVHLSVEAVMTGYAELLQKSSQAHGEERNRSLEASLQFSMQHLSDEARAALPAVALCAGGALDETARLVTGLDEDAWTRVRDELVGLGLVRSEPPALLPHTGLADAPGLGLSEQVEERFVAVVEGFCNATDAALRQGATVRAAMAAMRLSEPTLRRGLARALAQGETRAAFHIVTVLAMYLGFAGRAGEALTLRRSLAALGSGGEPDEATAAARREAALALDPEQAHEALTTLAGELAKVDTWDARFQHALTLLQLGRLADHLRNQPEEALGYVDEAIEGLRALEGDTHDTTNRAAALGDRSNALGHLKRYPEAEACASEGYELNLERGDLSAAARSLGQVGQIQQSQGKHEAAEHSLAEAQRLAGEAGDDETVAFAAGERALLALARSDPDGAKRLHETQLQASQRAGDANGVLSALNGLGAVCLAANRLAEAQEWFERLLTETRRLKGPAPEAVAHTNLAVVEMAQADRAEAASDPALARLHLEAAAHHGEAALALQSRLGTADIDATHQNLSVSYFRLGRLDEAERHAREANRLVAAYGGHELWKTCWSLEGIARARAEAARAAGDPAAAQRYDADAERWRQEKERLFAEAEEREGPRQPPDELLTQLIAVARHARQTGETLAAVMNANGAPDDFIPQVQAAFPWLHTHLQAIATSAPRPEAAPPAALSDLFDQLWSSLT